MAYLGVSSATGAAVPPNAAYDGSISTTAYPTAATAGNLVGNMADKAGRQVVVLNTVRDLVGTVSYQSTSGTPATLLASGGTGVYTDIISLTMTNENASTATIVSLSDQSVTYKFALAAAGGLVFNPATPLPATSTATVWQISNSGAVNVDCVLIYAKNK